MENLIFYLVPLIIIALFLYATLSGRSGRSPGQLPRREPTRRPSVPPARQAPAGTQARPGTQREREPQVPFTRSTASGEEGLERSTRHESAAPSATRSGPARGMTRSLPPVRTRQAPSRRARPSLLTTREGAREAFMTMELLRTPVGLRSGEDSDRMEG